MKIKIVHGFNDLQADSEAKRFVEADAEMTVSAARGAELIKLGLAVAADEKTPSAAAPGVTTTPPTTK